LTDTQVRTRSLQQVSRRGSLGNQSWDTDIYFLAHGSPFSRASYSSIELEIFVYFVLYLLHSTVAPVTGGNFVELVSKGFYDNMAIQRSDGFVVQTGDPDGKANGYVGKASKSIGAGPNGERLIPTEIFVRGDKGPFYETTIEDESRGGEATILPFSSYGAMGWAREEYDPNSGSSQFFWLLFDSDLTPAGKNVLDGRYPW
jgi:peptidylprolyl isomerase